MRLLFYLRSFFGDLDKSFSLGIAHASMALRSLNHDFIVHEALVLVLRLAASYIIWVSGKNAGNAGRRPARQLR